MLYPLRVMFNNKQSGKSFMQLLPLFYSLEPQRNKGMVV